MTDRTDILQRIANLRALAGKTTSEAEAMNAIAAADKMMRAYQVDEAEIAMAEGLDQIKVEVTEETRYGGLNSGRVRHKVQSVIWSLEQYCEVEVVLKRQLGGDHGIHAIGTKADIAMFWHLLGVIREAMDKSYARWKRGQQAVGRGAKGTFQLAMGTRIAQRLDAMREERDAERAKAEAEAAKALNRPVEEVRMAVNNGDLRELDSSTALVVASVIEQKRQAVQAAFREAYKNSRLRAASGFSYRGGTNAYEAGYDAGNRVGLGRPVGASDRKAIGC